MLNVYRKIDGCVKSIFLDKKHLKSQIVLVFFLIAILMFTSCSKFECKNLAIKEDLSEFKSFVDFIDKSDIDLYNMNAFDTKCYYLDSLIVFLKFNRKQNRDSSLYLLEIKGSSVSIFKPLERLAETYELGTEHRLYFEVKKIIDENIIDENKEIYINHQYSFVQKLYRGSDSLLNFIGLWHGKKRENKYDYSDTYFYVEWLTDYQVIQHYTLIKSIKCDTKYIFNKASMSKASML